MAGFFDALSAAITPAANAAAGYDAGKAQGQQQEADTFLKRLQLARQQQQDAEAKALRQAQMGHLNAQTDALRAPAPKAELVVPQGSTVLGGDRKPIFENPKPVEPKNPIMGSPEWEKAQRFKASLAPQDKTLVQIADPGDPSKSIYVPRDKAIGKNAKQTLKFESATNTAAQARLEAAVSEMNNAHSNMGQFEESLKNGTRKINAPSQLLGRVANAFTHDDPLSQLTQSGALSALNATDPELARYIRRGLSFAEGESMISQRPSDFRTKMAAFLSAAASGASPEMIGDIQGRRQAILDPLNRVVTPDGGGRSGTPPPQRRATDGKPMSDAAYKAAKAAGYSDAEITAKGYRIPSGGEEE